MPPPPFLTVSPCDSMRNGGAIPPPQKGYLSDTCVITYENKANGCDTPLCDTISKGYCGIWGGISHWAAKPTKRTYKEHFPKGSRPQSGPSPKKWDTLQLGKPPGFHSETGRTRFRRARFRTLNSVVFFFLGIETYLAPSTPTVDMKML